MSKGTSIRRSERAAPGSRDVYRRYGTAILIALLAALLRLALVPVMGPQPPYITFYLATVLAAALGGFGPGLLVMVLGAFFGMGLNVSARGFEVALQPAEQLRLALFFLSGVAITLIAAALHRARATAQEHARRANQTLESMSDAYVLLSRDWRVEAMNAQAERLLQHGRSELIGRNIWTTFPEADEFRKHYEQALAAGTAQNFEALYGPLNIWLDVSAHPTEDAVAVFFRDITERKRAEERLRASEEKYRSLFESLDDGFCVVEMLFDEDDRPYDYRFIETNPTFERQSGLVWAQGMTARELVPDLEPFWVETYGQVALTGKPVRFESHSSAMNRQFEVFAFCPVPGSRRVALHFKDITERKQRDELLRRSEAEFRALFELSAVGANLADFAGRIIRVNRKYCEMFGYSEAELLGTTVFEVTHPDDRTRNAELMQQLRRGEVKDLKFEKRNLRKDGQAVWIEVAIALVNDAEGNPSHVAAVVVDITERKRAEQALRASVNEAKRARDDLARLNAELECRVEERTAKLREMVSELEHFSYTITHDMRSPLRALHAFGRILNEEYGPALDGTARDYLRRIVTAASRMDHLINDALSYTKAVQSALPLKAVDPEPLLRGIVDSYPQFQAPLADVRIIGEFPSVLGNEAGLTQCISNLLGNAVKFVAPGKQPEVRVWAEERDGFVRLWFEDNGIGIAPEQAEQVFGMFQRLSRDYEGTGIGLALVSKVVERMKGKVGMESALGIGSRFWIELAKF